MYSGRVVAMLLSALVLQGPVSARAAPSPGEAHSPAAGTAMAPHTVLTLGAKVADWQLHHLDNFDYVPESAYRHDTEAPRNWIQAAFYIGLTAFADVSHQRRFTDAILAHGKAEEWGFDARPRHADADATGAVWVWAAQHTHDPTKLIPIKARFDAVLANPSNVSLGFDDKIGRA